MKKNLIWTIVICSLVILAIAGFKFGWFKAAYAALFQPEPETVQEVPKPGTDPEPEPTVFFYNDALQEDDDTDNDFNFGYDRYKAAVKAYNDSDREVKKAKFIADWLDEDFRKGEEGINKDPALAIADLGYADAVLNSHFLEECYEENICGDVEWGVTLNKAKKKAIKDGGYWKGIVEDFNNTFDKAEVKVVEIEDFTKVKDQMYMRSSTSKYGPDIVVFETDNQKGHLLVYTFNIKGTKVEVAYRAECGYQPCNVEKSMGIAPTTKPSKPSPRKPKKPTPKKPEPKKPTPKKPEPKPTPTPEKKYVKDTSKSSKNQGNANEYGFSNTGKGPGLPGGDGSKNTGETRKVGDDSSSKKEETTQKKTEPFVSPTGPSSQDGKIDTSKDVTSGEMSFDF